MNLESLWSTRELADQRAAEIGAPLEGPLYGPDVEEWSIDPPDLNANNPFKWPEMTMDPTPTKGLPT